MEDRHLDTIDVADEIASESGDEAAGEETGEVAPEFAGEVLSLDGVDPLIDEVDEILAGSGGSLLVARKSRQSGAIELVLVGIANAFWGVIGLILWLPQAVRVVLGATLRTIHAALTQQSSERAIAGIRRVSRFYVERFLHRAGETAMVGRRHELRPLRLLFEAGWAAAFYLLVLRWLAPDLFAPVWTRVGGFGARLREGAGALLSAGSSFVQFDLAALDFNQLQAASILVACSVLGVLLGFWLGRR